MYFALNRVRIEGFQQHSPNKTSFESSPLPDKFLPMHFAKPALPVFFSELKRSACGQFVPCELKCSELIARELGRSFQSYCLVVFTLEPK